MAKIFESAARAIVTVGHGRGFIVETYRARYVISAAHCLPFLPPCRAAAHIEERTYQTLLAPLGKNRLVSAECQFADPVADIAILGRPDTQALLDHAKAYDDFIDSHETLTITTAAMEGRAWMFALDGHRFRCTVEHRGRLLWTATDEPVTEEMSGSPILSNDGTAIGVVSVSSESGNIPRMHTGPDANLAAHLPAWFLQEIDRPPALAR